MEQKKRLIFRTSIILALLLIVTVSVIPVSALKVEGAKIMLDVKPGTTYLFPMAVSIKPEDAATDVAIDVLGFGQSPKGGTYNGLDAASDTSQYSARGFVSVERPVIHLKPGERVEFNAIIKVPSNANTGGRYALILVHPAPDASGQQTAFATAVAVPVMLTPDGGSLSETGEITSVASDDIIPGKPIWITTTLKNTGNHHYYGAINKITVTDSSGKIVATVSTEPFARAVIPGQSVRFDAPVSTPLSTGTYTVKSDMMLESGTILDSRSTSVTVKEAYIPPFQESSVKVTPDNPATLAVPEGTIRISFPQGSVLGETTVTIKPYTETLPALPAGAKAGTTAFGIDGLSGLLAKDATVTVKYSRTDLDAAHGDASKLVLGRYDRAESRWTLLPTSVDNNAMTLTASTNRFSIWAVIATDKTPTDAQADGSQTQSPGPEPLLICGLITLVLLVLSVRRK